MSSRKTVRLLVSAIVFCILGITSASASDANQLIKSYLNQTTQTVLEKQNPDAKRNYLESRYRSLGEILAKAANVSQEERSKNEVQELSNVYIDAANQLKSGNTVSSIPDGQLDRFARYMQDGSAQAAAIYIGGGALLLIIILILLLM